MAQERMKKYVNCPVCGKLLMKCIGQCNVDIICSKCNSNIAVFVDAEGFRIQENRNGNVIGKKAG